MAEKKFKQVCECKHCGNEAEMMITCTLEKEDANSMSATPTVVPQSKGKTKGQAVCSHCGNEADIWLDV